MSLNNHRKWREGIISYYGSLDKFPDARTIRIMLRFLVEEEKEITRILDMVVKGLGEDDSHAKALRAELEELIEPKAELEKWLKDKGLEP